MSVIRFENTSYLTSFSYSRIIELMDVFLGNIVFESKREDSKTNPNVLQTEYVCENFQKILLKKSKPQGLFHFSLDDHQKVSFTYLSVNDVFSQAPVLFESSDEKENKTIILWETSLVGLAMFKTIADIMGGDVYLDEKLVHSVSNLESDVQNEFLFVLAEKLNVEYTPEIDFFELYQRATDVYEDDLETSFFRNAANNCMTIAAASVKPLQKIDLTWAQEKIDTRYKLKQWEQTLFSPSPAKKNSFKIT